MRWSSHQWTVASLATGAGALVTLLLAVSTAHWLHMTENCTYLLPFGNITVMYNMTLLTNAGLWQLCSITNFDQRKQELLSHFVFPVVFVTIVCYLLNKHCVEVGISQGLEKERIESQWRTGAVIEATRMQFPLTCLAVILTLCGFVYSILGNYRKDKKTIIAAVLYISSGLSLSVSVIIFISRINDELALAQSQECPEFHYSYSWSFYLIGVSFVMEETSAVISIKLFLSRNFTKLDDMFRIIPGLEDKLIVETTRLSRIDSPSQTLIW